MTTWSPWGEDGWPQDETDPAAGGSARAGTPPDPALVADIAGHIGQIQAAASAAATALAGSGDLHAVRAGLDEIYEQAAQARRAARAAAGGKKAPAARPGGLREKVLAHLRANPGSSFTPHEIHKVTGHSSGAIANALDTLVKHGNATLASEKPRRFHLVGSAAAPAEAQLLPSPPPRTRARVRRRTWRVPHDHPRRWAGAAARRPGPPPGQRGRAVVRVQALGVRRRHRLANGMYWPCVSPAWVWHPNVLAAQFHHLGRTCQGFPGMTGPMRYLGYGDPRARVLAVAVLSVGVLRRYWRRWCGPQPDSAAAAVPAS